MKNKALIIIGAVMVVLAIISVVFYFTLKPSDDPTASEISDNSSVLYEVSGKEQTTRVSQKEPTEKTVTYKWESVVEPTISENYMIVTAAGGNGEWQVFENEDSYENAQKPQGGGIIFE